MSVSWMSVQLKRFGMYSYGLRQWTQRSVDTELLRSAKYDEGRQGHRVTGTRMAGFGHSDTPI